MEKEIVAMNLIVMISGSCDYLALPYTSPLKNQVTPHELLETSLEHTFVTKLEKVNETHKFINNKQVQEQLHNRGIQLIKLKKFRT